MLRRSRVRIRRHLNVGWQTSRARISALILCAPVSRGRGVVHFIGLRALPRSMLGEIQGQLGLDLLLRRSRYPDVWSQVFAVQCNYLTGWELNARTRRKTYADDRTYVLIVWPNSEPSVIRLTESNFCGVVTEAGCAERLSGRVTGRDEWRDAYGRLVRRTWQICQPGAFRRNCYRMLQ